MLDKSNSRSNSEIPGMARVLLLDKVLDKSNTATQKHPETNQQSIGIQTMTKERRTPANITAAPAGWTAYTYADDEGAVTLGEYPLAGWASLGWGRYEVEPFWYEPHDGITFLSDYDGCSNAVATVVGPGSDAIEYALPARALLRQKIAHRDAAAEPARAER